jgi:hypothetical protein
MLLPLSKLLLQMRQPPLAQDLNFVQPLGFINGTHATVATKSRKHTADAVWRDMNPKGDANDALHRLPPKGPGTHAGQATRAHTLPKRPRRLTTGASRPPPTIVRRPAFHELNFRCPRDLVLPVDSASWRKLARIIQASYCDVYAAWLFITNPCKCRAASSAKCSGNAGGRVKCPWATASYRELFGAHEEPPHRLSSCRAPAIGAMAHQ